MPHPTSGARRRGGPGTLYPIWLGLLAAGGVIALWLGTAPEPEPTPIADAGASAADAAVADAFVPEARFVWRIVEPRAVDAAALGGCLRAAGLRGALAVGQAPALTVTDPDVPRPQTVQLSPDGGVAQIRTARSGERRAWTRLHVATAACLRGPDSQLHDDALGWRWTAADWPQLGQLGGAPVSAFCRLEAMPGGRRTQGLARLDLREIGVQATGPAADLMLQQAAAALIGGADPADLRVGAQRALARPAAEVPGWGGPTDLSLLVRQDAPTVPLAPPARPAPAPKRRPASTGPRPRRPKRVRPRPTRPDTRAPKRPLFRPEYR